MFQLAVISDEVSQDLDTVIEFAQRFRLTGIEVRSLWDKGPFDFSPADVEKIRRKTAEAGLALLQSEGFAQTGIESGWFEVV